MDKFFMPVSIKIIIIKHINEGFSDMPDENKKWFIQNIKGYNKLNDEKREKIFEVIGLLFKESVLEEMEKLI